MFNEIRDAFTVVNMLSMSKMCTVFCQSHLSQPISSPFIFKYPEYFNSVDKDEFIYISNINNTHDVFFQFCLRKVSEFYCVAQC